MDTISPSPSCGFWWVALAGMVGRRRRPWHQKIIKRTPETAISGVRSLYCATVAFSTPGLRKRAERPSCPITTAEISLAASARGD
jgi:hypothetical protein